MGKIDVKTKDFWRDNEHFADLFNAVIFHGKQVLCAENLTEKDTDASAVIRAEKKYLEAVTKARDVVRKYAFGVEFALFAIENQAKVDYAGPVRRMSYDSLGYWRECLMISKDNRRKGQKVSEAELFSIGKEDRIHPIVTIVIYL